MAIALRCAELVSHLCFADAAIKRELREFGLRKEHLEELRGHEPGAKISALFYTLMILHRKKPQVRRAIGAARRWLEVDDAHG